MAADRAGDGAAGSRTSGSGALEPATRTRARRATFAGLFVVLLSQMAPGHPGPLASPQGPLVVRVEPSGAAPAVDAARSRALLQRPEARRALAGARYRVLSVGRREGTFADGTVDGERYCATVYDYTHARTLILEEGTSRPGALRILPSTVQPLPTYEEFVEAVRILGKDPIIGPALRDGRLRPYRPMPPLIKKREPTGLVERTLAVGLLPTDQSLAHEIVGVNMVRESPPEHFPDNAPEASQADDELCGAADAFQQTAPQGTSGQATISVTRGPVELWRFQVVRPAASSGIVGSGVELRFVEYRGKRVLARAHAPILNVRYEGDACGPFRDWLYEESQIPVNGADVAPGFRLSPTPVLTVRETRSDIGNFLGVGIYVQGEELVLVSEMEAGWYRYVSEWRLHSNGTIRPRFGFDAVNDSCVCELHRHHVYWRLDFDIRTAGRDMVEEYNGSPTSGSGSWDVAATESRRLRDPSRARKWRVRDLDTSEGYVLTPGATDGAPDAFGVGDVWLLRHHPDEIDDGQGYTEELELATAHIDDFVNGETLQGENVVVWYAGHVDHDEDDASFEFRGVVGPELTPLNW